MHHPYQDPTIGGAPRHGALPIPMLVNVRLPQVRTSDAQRTLAAMLRERVRREDLGDYLTAEADALRHEGVEPTTDQLIDRAMADAMAEWDRHNLPESARNHQWLSDREVGGIARANPPLGIETRSAVQRVRDLTPTSDPARIPTVTLETPHPGITLSQNGDIFTLSATADVPRDVHFTLSVDGHAFPFIHFVGFSPAQLEDVLPEGYGAQTVTGNVEDGAATLTLRISRDPPGWMTADDALPIARHALSEYTRTRRSRDPDWRSNFGITWDEAVANGVLDELAAFATPNPERTSGVRRNPNTFTFVGPGPLGLHSEIEIRKSDGRVLRRLIEID